MAARLAPVDTVRLFFVSNSRVLQLPTVDGVTVVPVLKDDPISAEKERISEILIALEPSTPDEHDAQNQTCGFHTLVMAHLEVVWVMIPNEFRMSFDQSAHQSSASAGC